VKYEKCIKKEDEFFLVMEKCDENLATKIPKGELTEEEI